MELKEDDPRAVKAMINFLYGFGYNNSRSVHGRMSTPMILDAHVYEVADKYGIESLRSQARGAFYSSIMSDWDSNDFSDGITELYSTPAVVNKSLRMGLVAIIKGRIDSLIVKDDFVEVLENVPVFAADMVRMLVHDRNPNITRKGPPDIIGGRKVKR